MDTKDLRIVDTIPVVIINIRCGEKSEIQEGMSRQDKRARFDLIIH